MSIFFSFFGLYLSPLSVHVTCGQSKTLSMTEVHLLEISYLFHLSPSYFSHSPALPPSSLRPRSPHVLPVARLASFHHGRELRHAIQRPQSLSLCLVSFPSLSSSLFSVLSTVLFDKCSHLSLHPFPFLCSSLLPVRQYNDGANSLYLCCGQKDKGSPHYKITFCPDENGR